MCPARFSTQHSDSAQSDVSFCCSVTSFLSSALKRKSFVCSKRK